MSETFPFKRQVRLAIYLYILRAIARGNGIPRNFCNIWASVAIL